MGFVFSMSMLYAAVVVGNGVFLANGELYVGILYIGMPLESFHAQLQADRPAAKRLLNRGGPE